MIRLWQPVHICVHLWGPISIGIKKPPPRRGIPPKPRTLDRTHSFYYPPCAQPAKIIPLMRQQSNPALQRFDGFDSQLLHAELPQMDLFQLSPGPFEGWLFSAPMENCRIAAGGFNQAVLVEGHYNPDTFHVGFILSLGHSAIVQAHEYDNGTLTIHRNAVAMHELFPAHLAWVDIAIPEKNVQKKLLPSISERVEGHSQIFLTGSRKTLDPIIQWVNRYIDTPNPPPSEGQLQSIVSELLSDRLDYHDSEHSFTEGDLFRMHLLEVTHKLAREKKPYSLSLGEICKAIDMKPRTVQKYFHEIYGMGPTEYFRMRRLNHVRTDLLQGGDSVSEIALRWGFNHLGRFSGTYKTHFGESPKTTLQRNPNHL